MSISWLRRVTRIEMLLRNVLYISYCLPASSLRPLVPDYLPLRLVAEDRAFLSIVLINCRNVHASVLPFPSFNYNQLNLRTYVLNPESGQPAVYFIKSGVTSPLISALTRWIGIPWQKNQFEIQITQDEQNQILELQSAGSWQTRFKIIAGRDLSPPSTLPPFNSITSAIDYLVRPLEGFFFNGRRLGHITIQHPEITPQFGILKLLDFPLLNQTISDKDLVPEKPHSLFFVNRTHFFIYMPPRFKKISG